MSLWADHDMDQKVRAALESVPLQEPHHFGRPYMSAYQVAFAVERLFPGTAEALDLKPGGRHTGERTSLAQYIARELSKRIGKSNIDWIDGAFVSNVFVRELSYEAPDGTTARSSLTGTGFDLSLFRLRDNK